MWAIVARSFYEMRLMTERYVSDGMIFGEGDDERRVAAMDAQPVHRLSRDRRDLAAA